MARSGALWQRPAVVTFALLCCLAAAAPVAPVEPARDVSGDVSGRASGAVAGDPANDPAPGAALAAPDLNDRLRAGAGAAVGGGAGGFVGGALALGLSAALAGVVDGAALLPLIVLPPLFSGFGAFVVGSALSGPTVGLAGGAGAGGLSALWSVAVGALVVSADGGLLAGRFDLTFAATALAPAVAGVVGAGLTAPFFAGGE